MDDCKPQKSNYWGGGESDFQSHHITTFKLFSSHKKKKKNHKTCQKTEENMVYLQEKKNLTETIPEEFQTLEWLVKGIIKSIVSRVSHWGPTQELSTLTSPQLMWFFQWVTCRNPKFPGWKPFLQGSNKAKSQVRKDYTSITSPKD